MSDIIAPEDAVNQKLVTSNKGKQLIPGHRDEKVIFPLSVLQDRVQRLEENNQRLQMLQVDMMREYGPSAQSARHASTMVDIIDIAMTALMEILEQESKLFSKEMFQAKVNEVEQRKAKERADLEDAQSNRKVVDKAAEKGDTICIDFSGKLDGQPMNGLSAKRHNLLLGSGQFIPGFEEQLIGLKAGETKSIKVSFPADYRAPQLASKEVEFEIFVHAVKQTIDPKSEESNGEGK